MITASRIYIIICTAFLLPAISLSQQLPDSTLTIVLDNVQVTAIKNVQGTGHMPQSKDGILYTGKKNEVILIDSLDANKAINNTRQILGRIPGLNIVETESGGFTANGVATRGLNPSQSMEMNTRQNGYNISADVFGYNEAYYIPPMEAVNRIEMVRGAASLQFGSQFGGMINYVLHDPPQNKRLQFYSAQTAGSFGLFNSFNSMAGTSGKLHYYTFLQYRTMQGWRPNSKQWQLSGFGKLQYDISSKLKLGVEYSLLRNSIKMPGGLSDSMFKIDPRTSLRSRNWLNSPWNIVAANAAYTLSPATTINTKLSWLFSQRSLVWRNEEGGAGASDSVDAITGHYVNREVEKESMHNVTLETRILHTCRIGKTINTLSAGVRVAYAWFRRLGGGEGTTGSDFDLSVNGNFEYALDFTTLNIAPFIENSITINRLKIVPGLRLEYLRSTGKGYKTESQVKVITNENRERKFLLFGLGSEYKVSRNTNVYANFSQAYRPMDYAQLTGFGITSKIDPHLKDAKGFNADLGYRGTVSNYLNYDIGFFYLAYNNRIGIVVIDPGMTNEYSLRTNVANSVHEGLESYIEFNILKYFDPASAQGLSLFNSLALIDATYTTGAYKGNRVEASANTINRVGLIFSDKKFSATLQMNNIGDAYGDASNTRISTDPVAGYIPAYTVFDLSTTFKVNNIVLKAGINNILDKKYFTKRTDEYPGPGIIPSIGSGFYIGGSVRF